jgi:HPt (histidine-containing phosphotransfer) domain-containing protein
METLNAAVLSELQSFMDEDEFPEFMRTAHQKLQQHGLPLFQCMAVQNWSEVRRMAHSLKGTLGSVGCDKLYSALHALELGLRQTPPVLPQAKRIEELSLTLQETLQALSQRDRDLGFSL